MLVIIYLNKMIFFSKKIGILLNVFSFLEYFSFAYILLNQGNPLSMNNSQQYINLINIFISLLIPLIIN